VASGEENVMEGKAYSMIDLEAWTERFFFLECRAYPLVGRWQSEGQAASRLRKGFKASAADASRAWSVSKVRIPSRSSVIPHGQHRR